MKTRLFISRKSKGGFVSASGSVFTLVLALLMVAVSSCANREGSVQQVHQAQYHQIGKITKQAHLYQAGTHTVELSQKGLAVFYVGNPDSDQAVEVRFNGQTTQTIAPNQWTFTKMETADGVLSFETSAPVAISTACFPGRAQSKRKNMLLISIDTLRQDFFNEQNMPLCYNFFREGSLFTHAYSPAPWTLPAHTSLLTSLFPSHHGVRKPEHKLSPEIDTLAKELSQLGYYNLAITEGNYLDPMYGLASGFHSYLSDPPQLDSDDPQLASKLKTNIAILEDTLKADVFNGSIPLFVFFHTYEVHCPFLPRGSTTDPEHLGSTKWLLEHEISGFSQDDLKKLRELYGSEVQYTDRVLYNAIARLDPEKWIIVLMSDHGEEFGEHGGLLHADTLFEEVLRVPLAIEGPGILKQQVSHSVSIMDVAPTLLNLVGGIVPESWQGLDLFNLPEDINEYNRVLFSETFFLGPHIPSKDPCILAVTSSPDKFIQKRNFGEEQYWFFNLDHDPEEKQNLLPLQPDSADRLKPLLQPYLSNQREAMPAGDLSDEQIKTMKSLGYLD
ncbi:MAG: hypothetical protein CSA81_12005 [Acidobacteria bacterium]|nr:MAG: hypothetical protein CSA81_12005 [Acidobacteriota bacterium]